MFHYSVRTWYVVDYTLTFSKKKKNTEVYYQVTKQNNLNLGVVE